MTTATKENRYCKFCSLQKVVTWTKEKHHEGALALPRDASAH